MDEPLHADNQSHVFGRRLREARENAGLGVRAAARAADLSEGLWRQLELGYRQVAAGVRVPTNPRASTVRAAAQAVGLDVIEALELVGHTAAAEMEKAGKPVSADGDIHLIGLPPLGVAALPNQVLLAELARRLGSDPDELLRAHEADKEAERAVLRQGRSVARQEEESYGDART